MDESGAVFAAQIYCPIIDLEHANMAYEWMFQADKTCEGSPAGPAGTMTPFKAALPAKLAARYVRYFHALELKDPATGAPLTLDEGGRSGSGYGYLMSCLNTSVTDFFCRLVDGELSQKYSVQDYLSGNYTYLAPAPSGAPLAAHHAGLGETLPNPPPQPMSLGNLVPVQGMAERPEQVAPSHLMLDALGDSSIALCDAGTGIGKTYTSWMGCIRIFRLSCYPDASKKAKSGLQPGWRI